MKLIPKNKITWGIILLALFCFLIFCMNPRETYRIRYNKDIMWRSILFAIQMYAQEHERYFPNDLGMLIDEGYLPGIFCICAGSKTKCPESGDDVRNGNTDFIYIAEGRRYEEKGPSMTLLVNSEDIFNQGKVKFYVKDNSPVIVTKPGCHKNFLVLYSNGSVIECEILSKDISDKINDIRKNKEIELSK